MEANREGASGVSDGRDGLIREGAPRYLQAVVALREFQRVIQERCKTIVSNRLEDIAKATKVSLEEKKVWEYPDLGKHTERSWDGKSVWLAVAVSFQDVGSMYFGLCWEYRKGPEPTLLAITTLALNSRELFNRAWKKLGKRSEGTFHNYPWENREISVYQSLPLEQAASFSDKLEAVIDVWLDALNEVGGVSGLVSDKPRSEGAGATAVE
jgi:hypothetical protein